MDYTALPRVTYTDPELARVGISESEARAQGIEHRVYRCAFDDIDRARAEGETRGFAKLIANPAVNWLYSSEPEASTNGRRLPVPRGRILGGSSAINGLAFVRGQAQDFDSWAQMGNRGWSYQDVLPFFKRMETYESGGDDRFRGRSGPLRVTNPEPREPFFADHTAIPAE